MATTTETKDFLGRDLVTPGSASKDYLGRDTTSTVDYLGRKLAPVNADATSISPATGAAAGGTAVTILGTDFEGTTGVTFGGTPATSVVVVHDGKITCTTPAHAAGAVNVVVQNPDGNDTMTGAFTYS